MSFTRPLRSAVPRLLRTRRLVLDPRTRPLIMGILNVTPDSFFDGGQSLNLESALKKADGLIEEGADLLDIGGESTRPGAIAVSVEEELKRTIPLIQQLRKNWTGPISIDTMKSEVAIAALDAGADIINDVSAMRFDRRMLEVPQSFGAAVILNHMRGEPKTMQGAPHYANAVTEVYSDLAEQAKLLAALGQPKERIALDPGIGFGKRLQDNYSLLENLEVLDDLGYPILVGHSRKSFIGKTAGLEGSDRLFPSIAVAVFAALKGASILRVHDVKATLEAMIMIEAIRRAA